MEQKNVAEEVVRERVWALLCLEEFGPCQPLLQQRYHALKGRHRTLLQCHCGVPLPPLNKAQEDESEDEDEEEESEEEEREEKKKQEEEKEKKRARFSYAEQGKEEKENKNGSYFEARTLQSLCLVAAHVDNWIKQKLEQQPKKEAEEEPKEEERNGQDGYAAALKKITDHKTCIQSLNNKVEALVQQLHEALEDTSSFCSSCSCSSCSSCSSSSSSSASSSSVSPYPPPTYLHAFPSKLLHAMMAVPSSVDIKPQQHGPPQRMLNFFGGLYWKALYYDQSLARLLEDITVHLNYADGLSEEQHHKEGKEETQQSKYIHAFSMLEALFPFKTPTNAREASPFWKKLLRQQANEDSYDDDTSGAFTYLPSLDRLSWSGDTQKEAIGELVLSTMRESLLFVTLVSIGWQDSWDDFLIGVSPLSGRLVGLHTLTGSFRY